MLVSEVESRLAFPQGWVIYVCLGKGYVEKVGQCVLLEAGARHCDEMVYTARQLH